MKPKQIYWNKEDKDYDEWEASLGFGGMNACGTIRKYDKYSYRAIFNYSFTPEPPIFANLDDAKKYIEDEYKILLDEILE